MATATAEPQDTTMADGKTEVKSTSYVVMAAYDDGGEPGFFVISTEIVEGNGGQRQARKQAYAHRPEIQKAVQDGERVFLAAVPASSWKPQEIKLEQREPRLLV